MLLLLYRSFITTIILLITVGMELQVARDSWRCSVCTASSA